MPVGFQSLIPGGSTVQIDTESRCYGLISQSTTSSSSFTVSTTGVEKPIIFVSQGVYATSANTFVNYTGGTVSYFVFGLIPTASSGIGLQLLNSLGIATFDSNYPPLIVHYAGMSDSSIPNGTPGNLYAIHYGGLEESAYNTGIEVNGEVLYEFSSLILSYSSSTGVFNVAPTVVSDNLAPEGAFNEYSSPSSFIIIADITGISGSLPSVPSYSITPNVSNIDEGDSVTFTVATTNFGTGTLYYSILGDNISSSDFSTPLTGTIAVNNNTGSLIVTSAADLTTEGTESFTLRLKTGSQEGPTVATSNTITIDDTSTTPAGPTYAITPSVSNVDEGDSVTFTVATTNFGSGTLYWRTTGTTSAGDFTNSTSGSVSITNNSGSIVRTLANDLSTEGFESFALQLSTDSNYINIVAISDTVTVRDTSVTPAVPTYSISSSSSVNEGTSLACSVGTTNVANGTTLYWYITHITTQPEDFSATSGSLTISSNQGTFSIPVVADLTTEGPQTFSVNISTTPGGAAVATRSNITIGDTSTSPPTYSIQPPTGVSSVNEGDSITFTVTTTNFGSGTLYWRTTGTTSAGDFTNSTSGSVSITNNSGSIVRTLVNDLSTEGFESFALQLSTDSNYINIVATSSTVTVNDTSTTPVADVTPNAVNWANISGVSPIDTISQTISGITATITLSITRTGNASNVMTVFVNGASAGSVGNGASNVINFTVNNGDTVFFRHTRISLGTTNGTATIRNVSDGNVTLDTYTYSVTAS